MVTLAEELVHADAYDGDADAEVEGEPMTKQRRRQQRCEQGSYCRRVPAVRPHVHMISVPGPGSRRRSRAKLFLLPSYN